MSARIGTCERCESALERGDLRCPVCTLAAPAVGDDRAQVQLEVLRCKSCGAALAYDAKHAAPACAFCRGVLELESIADPVEQTQAWLPFQVSAKDARDALARWQASLSWFRPSDLRSASRVTELIPLWWAAWVFDAQVLVSWTADSDAGSQRADWAPHAGQTRLACDDLVASASRGLSTKETDVLSRSYNWDSEVFEPTGLDEEQRAHAALEGFDAQRSEARVRVREAMCSDLDARIARDHVPGSKHRNLHVEPLVQSLVTRRLGAPAWVLAYRYQDALYRVVISGQDAKCLIGKAPWSTARIALAVLGGLVVLALVAVFAIAAAL